MTEMTKITYWPKGYADEDGLASMIVPGRFDDASAQVELHRRRVGSFAKVWSAKPHPAPQPMVEEFDEEYRREMSARDNS